MARYSIWIVDCGRSDFFTTEHLYCGFYRKDEPAVMAMGLAVVKGEGRNILIDSGVDTDPVGLEMLHSRGYTKCISPTIAVERVGVKPEEVTDVIVTHAHWDHIGAIHCFPNARFYIQKEEYLKYLEWLALPPEFSILTRCVTQEHFVQLLDLSKEHRLTLLDGPCDNLLPGIHIKTGSGHSVKMQMAIIETENQSYIAVGDAAYAEEGVLRTGDGRYLPTGMSVAAGTMRDMLFTMQEIDRFCEGDIKRVLIVHDVRTWERYPSSSGEFQIAEVCLASGETSKI
ncbi:MAG: MBL fold metallo-hydrolase [Synergistaceae bacterium]|nr:MBL fold metallo-hydrolase [Synergistaceae bacterium]